MSDRGRRFASDDDEAQYYLGVLRDGTREQKIEARERLSQLFEARGMLAEACELLEGNARTGLRSRSLFTRLASLYRRLGRDDDADAAMAEAASMMASGPPARIEPQPVDVRPLSLGNVDHGPYQGNVLGQAVGSPPGASGPGAPYSSPPGYSGAQPKKKRSTIQTLGLGCLGCGGLLVVAFVILAAIGSRGTPNSTATATQEPSKPQSAESPPKPTTPPVAVGQSASTPKPVAKVEEKASGPARVGQRVESGGIAVTVVGVQRAEALGQFLRAKPGRTYVIADVLIESVSRDNAPYNPLYFKVKDSEGQEYNGSLIGDDKSLKSGELPRGDKARGTVAFDVPTTATGLVASYQPVVLFGGYQTIRIALD